MKCPHCSFDNPDGFAFCGKCGKPLATGDDRLTPADLDHLRAYLPSSLVEALQYDPVAPAHELIAQCTGHLLHLLETTATYLPSYVVDHILRDPTPGQTGGQFVEGSLLFADISGFTAMSERLSRIGREGAEEISAIVNRHFASMLSILRERDGHPIKFGGDALLGLFPEPDSAARAARAALSMQAAMQDFVETRTSQGSFALQMKVGIRRGRFFAAQLGTPQNMEYALFGPDVNATAAAEAVAQAGQVLIDRETRDAIGARCRATPLPNSERYVVVEHIDPTPAAPRTPAISDITAEATLTSLRRAVKLLDALTPYMPAGLLARLASGPQAASLEGEHRLVAVLFANAHGLGEVVDRLGPGREDRIIAALNRYFVDMGQAINRMGGVINKIDLAEQGDKLLAFFGAPLAHEDDAERAVRAALAMQTAMAELSKSMPGQIGLPDLRMHQHIGVSYGYVFAGYVGTSWRREYTVMGDEVNLAARLMTVSDPGGVTVSPAVRRKVHALFDLTPRGEASLKGKSEPVHTFSIDGVRSTPERLRGLEGMHSPLVGRDAEWAQLQDAAGQLRMGRGQIVSIVGEAGLGKSRLAVELRDHLHQTGGPLIDWFEGRCLSYTESVSYRPFQDLMRHLLGLRTNDSEPEAWRKLRGVIEAGLSPEQAVLTLPYLADFLGLPLDEALADRVRHLDAEALQRRTFLAIRTLIEAQAMIAPLVLALDDIHWIDQASVKLLEYLMPVVDAAPVMLLLLYRPERTRACWQIREKAAREFSHCATEVSLGRLTSADSQQLLGNLVRLSAWPPAVGDLILKRIEGNPLYLEEVLRALIDSGVLTRDKRGNWRISGDVESLRVPDTLQGVMMARLDRLEEPPRRTAQIASVVGRTFPFDVLAHVAIEHTTELNPNLVRLQQNEIVREEQRAPELVYAFQHGMMQEVCYGSLLARTRRDVHRKIAEYLADRRFDVYGEGDGDVALLAHHAFAGQDWPRALHHLVMAGRHAQRLFANHEAIDHFAKALQSAEHLPPEDTLEARQAIHAALGELLTTTGQYDQAQSHLHDARALAVERGDAAAQARACRWLARLHELRGEFQPALEWIDQGLAGLAGQQTAEAVEMRINAGLVHSRRGDYDRALEQCQEALRMAQQLDAVTVLARAYNLLGHVTRLLGQSAMAIEDFRQALELYERAGDIHGQAMSQNQLANAYFDIGQWREADHNYRHSREAFNLLGDVYNRAFADNNLGGIALNQGRLDDALEFYHAALSSLERIGGSDYVLGVLHSNLGGTFTRRGELDEAQAHLQASLRHFERAQSRDFLPELYRRFAEAALAADDVADATGRAEQALSIARELSMRGEEGISLRLLAEAHLAQDRGDEAERLLRDSLTILEDVKDEYESTRARAALAKAWLNQGRREDALAEIDRCIDVFRRLDAALDLEAAQALRGRAARES